MQTLIEYFRSAIGVLKIAAVIFVAAVVTLVCYSHFDSHWTHHDPANKVGLNDYEECVKTNPTSAGGSSLYCANPALEIVLIATAIPILLLSIIFLLLICNLSKPISSRLWCQLKCYEVLFHGLCALFLFIGGILFLVSAYYIAEWCATKSSNAVPVVSTRLHHDDIAVVRTADIDDPQRDGMGRLVSTGILPVADDTKPQVRVLVPSGPVSLPLPQERSAIVRNMNVVNSDEEFCRSRVLVVEKYWAGGAALFAALLYTIIACMIYRSAKKSEVGCFGGTTQATQTETKVQRQYVQRKCRAMENACGGGFTDPNDNKSAIETRNESVQAGMKSDASV